MAMHFWTRQYNRHFHVEYRQVFSILSIIIPYYLGSICKYTVDNALWLKF